MSLIHWEAWFPGCDGQTRANSLKKNLSHKIVLNHKTSLWEAPKAEFCEAASNSDIASKSGLVPGVGLSACYQ